MLVSSCKKDDQSNYQEVERRNSIDAVLASAGDLPQGELRKFSSMEETKDVIGKLTKRPTVEYFEEKTPDVPKPGIYRLVQRTLTLSGYELAKEYTTNLNPDVVWPGNLIYAKSIESPALKGISELNRYRTPGRVTMAVLNGSDNLTREITDYRFSEVNKKLNELVVSCKDELPANFTYTINTVQTIGEAAYHLRIPEDELKRDDRYKIFRNIDWTNGRYKSVLTFSQDLFTLVYDDPEYGPASLFNSSLTPDVLRKFTSKGNPLGYISSVTYGRRCIAIIEETERTYETKADQEEALVSNLSYSDKIKKEGERVGRAKPNQIAKNLKIYLHLVGGKDIFSTNISLTPTMKELQDFLIASSSEKSKNFGVPVACTIKYLHELKPLSIPRKADGKYTFQEYIPEIEDNEMSLSDMRIEGRGYSTISSVDKRVCLIDSIEVYYNIDNAEQRSILLRNHQETIKDYSIEDFDPKTGTYRLFSFRIPGVTMPPFGVSPKGYIQIVISMRDALYWHSGGDSQYNPRENHEKITPPIRRSVYFRFNPQKGGWYIDTNVDGSWEYWNVFEGIKDEPFKMFVTKMYTRTWSNQHKLAVLLHYTLSTKLLGPLPYEQPR